MSKPEIVCFLDLETTGHDPLKRLGGILIPWHEIIEIGAVFADINNCIKKNEWEIKINPEHPERCLPNLINDYLQRSAAGEWKEAVSLSQALKSFQEYCAFFECPIILAGQNFTFDWSFLAVALAYCGITDLEWSKIFHYGRLDTRSMVIQEFRHTHQYNPDDYSLRNDRLSKRLDIAAETYPHGALNGARQSYFVYKRLSRF